VRAFLKQRALWIGMIAVTAPLAFILYRQYGALRTLEQTLPIYRREVMMDYLRTVTSDLEMTYREAADRVLSIPSSAITGRTGGAIQVEKSGSAVVEATRQVAELYAREQFEGARRLFLVVDTENQGWHDSAVLFFDSSTKSLRPDPAAPELRAINVACAPYLIYIRSSANIAPWSMGIDRDPRFPLIVKPVLDEHKQIIAVAGMAVDEQFFLQKLLPEALERHLLKFFPEDHQDLIVAIHDESGEQFWGSEPIDEKEAEASTRFGLIFQRWYLLNRMRHETEEQWARRFFTTNAAIWMAMAVLLLGGLALTLRAASRAMRLSQMKSEFVSNVSHELRTPLASIRVFGEFFKLGRVNDPAKAREYGEYIETESRRLTGLINNILDFAKIESGQKEYDFQRADLTEVVAETLKTFEVRMKQSDFDIRFDADRNLPPVRIDSDAITQALVNLLDNAVKYSGDSREIAVRLDARDGWVTISVSDRGIGIPASDQEKIFDRFHRVSTGLVHEVRGSGLGLAIVKHIVDAHRGRVTVESRPGRGSTFTIWLPSEDSAIASPNTPRREVATSES